MDRLASVIDGTFSDLARGLGAGRTWTFLEVEMIFSSDRQRPWGRETIRKLDFGWRRACQLANNFSPTVRSTLTKLCTTFKRPFF